MSNQELLVFAVYELAETFGVDMSDARKEFYCEALQDIDPEAVRVACKQLAKTQPNWFPLPGKIREVALIDPSRITAEQAWELVCERIRRVGFNGGSGDLDPEIKAAINACGGWGELCRSERPDNDRFRFIKAFNSAREQADRKRLLEGDQTPQEMPAELTEGTRQIEPVEQLPPAEDRFTTSLERLREARKDIEENRRQKEQEIPDELVEGLEKIGHRGELEPSDDKFKISLERLRQARKDIEENRKQSEQRW